MPQTESPTPTETKSATPSPAPGATSNGTAPQNAVSESTSQAPVTQGQTEPNAETFTNVDVKSLSPELQSKYNAMLTDYKKKTTEAANMRKEAETRLQEVQNVVQSPDFQKAYSALTTSQQTQVREDMGISDDEFNRAFENKDNFAKFIQKVAQVSNASSQREIVDLKASLLVKDFKQNHADWDKLNKHGFITYQLKTDPRAQGHDEKQWRAAMNDAYENASRVHSELIEEGKRMGLQRINEKVSQSTEPPSESIAQIYPGGDPKNLTTAEAVALARKGIRVPAGR